MELYYTGYTFYSSISTSWRRRGLKRVPRTDLYKSIQRACLPTCGDTIYIYIYTICTII